MGWEENKGERVGGVLGSMVGKRRKRWERGRGEGHPRGLGIGQKDQKRSFRGKTEGVLGRQKHGGRGWVFLH